MVLACSCKESAMHTIQVYIDETLDAKNLDELRKTLLSLPYIENVAINTDSPHDVLIEYEEHHVMPMQIVETMNKQGIHTDIISG
jgi:cell division septal protein FtsQ